MINNILCDIIMKKLNLITFNNSYYTEDLIKAGFLLSSINPADIYSNSKSIRISADADFTIVELPKTDELNAEKILLKIPAGCRTLVLSRKIMPENKKFLLKNSVSYVIPPDNINHMITFLQCFDNSENNTGKIVIMEKDPVTKTILSSIITSFGYTPVFVGSVDEIFSSLKLASLQFILLNLEIKGLDVNGLVRRSYNRKDIKEIPLIAYKDISKGLYVHKVISGLNRLTKVILDTEELYSFLFDILSRKEIMPLVDHIKSSLKFEEKSSFSKQPLRQIYHSYEKDIFSMTEIFDKSNIETVLTSLDSLKKSLIKTDALKWLKTETGTDIKTCGVYG